MANKRQSLENRDDIKIITSGIYTTIYPNNFVDWLVDIKNQYPDKDLQVLVDDNGYSVYYILSKEEIMANHEASEKIEYERLKDEFEPDPEDVIDLDDEEVEVPPTSKKGWFSKLFGK